MKEKIFFGLFAIFIYSCSHSNKRYVVKPLRFDVEKIFIVDNSESKTLYFKLKIENPNDRNVILSEGGPILDQSLHSGFYLQSSASDSIKPLRINNYFFYELGASKVNYCYVGTPEFEKLSSEKDSIKLKKEVLRYRLIYNGRQLNLDSIKKSRYISKTAYEYFLKEKANMIPIKDSLQIKLDINKLRIVYLRELPHSQEDWDKL